MPSNLFFFNHASKSFFHLNMKASSDTGAQTRCKKVIKWLLIWASITGQSHHRSEGSSFHMTKFQPSFERSLSCARCPVWLSQWALHKCQNLCLYQMWTKRSMLIFCILLEHSVCGAFISVDLYSVHVPPYSLYTTILNMLQSTMPLPVHWMCTGSLCIYQYTVHAPVYCVYTMHWAFSKWRLFLMYHLCATFKSVKRHPGWFHTQRQTADLVTYGSLDYDLGSTNPLMVVGVVLMQNWCQMATSGLPFAMKCCIPINIFHPDQIFKCNF